MRPKLIALIAVTGFALTGCSTHSPHVETSTTSVAPVATEPSQEVTTQEVPTEPVAAVEEQFADFAELRAEMNAAAKPDREKVIEGLHEYCETGEPFDVSKTEDLNKNLDAVAEMAYCDRLESK